MFSCSFSFPAGQDGKQNYKKSPAGIAPAGVILFSGKRVKPVSAKGVKLRRRRGSRARGFSNGSKNEDYCIYCYKDGAFTQDCSMEEMIDFCAQFVDEVNKNMPKPMSQEEYKQMMRQYFPMLKRWKSAQ